MYVTLVSVHVKREHLDEFIAATRANHEGSIREPGCLRFDVLQLPDDSSRFLLYEAYRDEAARNAHRDTPHYQAWRDSVGGWMVEPRTAVVYNGLFPSGDGADPAV
jgi:(4S)-4-hydroxy-5-phosphonooxypentane-2,3-dione isomerase